ncbi:hypothetical protein OC834_004864 [Tilletia horrida]|nr:hypothetical protein OC834_004864 [Tilletia horrida]
MSASFAPSSAEIDNVLALRYVVVALVSVVIWEHVVLFPQEAVIWAKVGARLFPSSARSRTAGRAWDVETNTRSTNRHQHQHQHQNQHQHQDQDERGRFDDGTVSSSLGTMTMTAMDVSSPTASVQMHSIRRAARPGPSSVPPSLAPPAFRQFEPKARRRSRVPLTPADIAVLVMRYANLGLAVTGCIFFLGRPASCARTIVVAFSFFDVASVAVNGLFVMRVYLLYSRSVWVLGLLVTLALVDTAFWLNITISWNVIKLPVPEPEPYCGFPMREDRLKHHIFLEGSNFAPRLAFDVVILFLTLFRLGTLPNTMDRANLPTADEEGERAHEGAEGRRRLCGHMLRARLAAWRSAARRIAVNLVTAALPEKLRVRFLGPPHPQRRMYRVTSQADVARAYLMRSNLAYFIICFVVTLVAFVLDKYVKEVYTALIGTVIGMVFPPILAVRIVLSTPSRHRPLRQSPAATAHQALQQYEGWRQQCVPASATSTPSSTIRGQLEHHTSLQRPKSSIGSAPEVEVRVDDYGNDDDNNVDAVDAAADVLSPSQRPQSDWGSTTITLSTAGGRMLAVPATAGAGSGARDLERLGSWGGTTASFVEHSQTGSSLDDLRGDDVAPTERARVVL